MKTGKIVQFALFIGIILGVGANTFSYGSGVNNLLLKTLSIKHLIPKANHKQSCIDTINRFDKYIDENKYSNALMELDKFKNNPCTQSHENEEIIFASSYLCLKTNCDKERTKQSVSYLEERAQKGDIACQFALGNYFTNNSKEYYDFDRGVAFLSKAAKSGDRDAQYVLGLLFIDDESEHFDPKKATTYFAQAYKQGDYDAAYELGLIYYDGVGVRKNSKKALEYFIFSAERGEGDGAAYAATLLYNSSKSEEDVRKACYFSTIAHLLDSIVLNENPEIREKICPSLPKNTVVEIEAAAKQLVDSLGDKF